MTIRTPMTVPAMIPADGEDGWGPGQRENQDPGLTASFLLLVPSLNLSLFQAELGIEPRTLALSYNPRTLLLKF